MNREWARNRIDDARPVSQQEGLLLLRALLAEARQAASRLDDAIVDAAVLTLGALDGVDHSADSTEEIVAELNADGRRVPALNELLRRMLDRDADDRLLTVQAVEAALEEVERALARVPPPAEPSASSPGSKPRDPAPDPSPATRRLALAGLAAIPLALVGLLAVRIGSETSGRDHPTFVHEVTGSRVEAWTAERLRRAEVDWATDAADATSRFDLLEWVRYAPDVFPANVPEDFGVWRANHTDDGLEWVVMRWPSPRPALGVVVVETFGGGAIVAVDDELGSHTSTISAGSFDRLWSGSTSVHPGKATVILLPEPRTVGGVRVVFDTSRVPGPNHLDAVGLVVGLGSD